MSEFGKILSLIYDGQIILREDNSVVFVSSAFNPLTAAELRDIASRMEEQC
jgi:hypothetical protein